jgi:hypothetical protein
MDEGEDVQVTQGELDQLDDELDAGLLINRTRWQYRVVNLGMFNAPDRMAAVLGHLGSQGWELISIYDKQSNWLQAMEKGFALFKRVVPPGAHPDGEWAKWAYANTRGLPKPAKATPEGWLADPSGRHPDRWWDGSQWTKWVRDKSGGTRSEDPPVVDLF